MTMAIVAREGALWEGFVGMEEWRAVYRMPRHYHGL